LGEKVPANSFYSILRVRFEKGDALKNNSPLEKGGNDQRAAT
jgi:hypothetical protein